MRKPGWLMISTIQIYPDLSGQVIILQIYHDPLGESLRDFNIFQPQGFTFPVTEHHPKIPRSQGYTGDITNDINGGWPPQIKGHQIFRKK